MSSLPKINDAITQADFSNVEKPMHYNSHPSGVECIRVTAHHLFTIGNALKYIWRAGLKVEGTTNEAQDMEKAVQYLKFHISFIQYGDPRAAAIPSPRKLSIGGVGEAVNYSLADGGVHKSGLDCGDVNTHHDPIIASVFRLLWKAGTGQLAPQKEIANTLYAIQLLEYKIAECLRQD